MAEAQKHDVFQAVADPSRRKILQLLTEKNMPVAKITGHFSMSRTAVSKHLRILAEAELVESEKFGRETHYRLQPEGLQELKDWLSYFEQFWDNKLEKLRCILEDED
ncbi:ArsR/SmtB family transcription factor [Alteribacillus sp. HJP-4]|uniref:ArsR/SmtB family transcription factor n=1 Tax=Alteribacillus sp. HJP-4 TaxID=2775394 RepID=UPI0035CCE25C